VCRDVDIANDPYGGGVIIAVKVSAPFDEAIPGGWYCLDLKVLAYRNVNSSRVGAGCILLHDNSTTETGLSIYRDAEVGRA
jgi:hypothetical protein